MGAKNVFVLDGGFDGWKAAGYPVTDEPTKIAASLFTPAFDQAGVVAFPEMREIVDERRAQVADARAAGRFTGRDAEPRAGMRSGHMPGARNVPVGTLSENGELKDLDSLRAIFDKAGVDLAKPVVTSCGSGVTRRSSCWRWPRSAIRITGSMTAPGVNGAAGRIRRW